MTLTLTTLFILSKTRTAIIKTCPLHHLNTLPQNFSSFPNEIQLISLRYLITTGLNTTQYWYACMSVHMYVCMYYVCMYVHW